MAKTIVPVADLRIEPRELLPKNFDHHDLRDSQLLFNEEVKVLETQGEWVKVAAVEQPCYSEEKGWSHCLGWMHKSEIGEGSITPNYVVTSLSTKYSFGTYLETPTTGARPIPKTFNRKKLIQDALLFLDAPYLWGGRSSPLSHTIASVDCSGFIDLLYRAQGIRIPRNAHDQFLFGRETERLQAGDPLYLTKEGRISHVILKIEESCFIESPESGKYIRLLYEGKDYWKKEERWHFKGREGSYLAYPRSFAVGIT